MGADRRCLFVRGDEASTRAQALELSRELDADAVLWVGAVPEARFVTSSAAGVKRLLGRAFDAVVLDLHEGVDADVLGQCQGLVRGGGALVLRLPLGLPPPPASLIVPPFRVEDVSQRFWQRFERLLTRSPLASSVQPLDAIERPTRLTLGTEGQEHAVAALARAFLAPRPSVVLLLSDRGRGKSSALGLALRRALVQSPLRVAVTAASPASTEEVYRFALAGAAGTTPAFSRTALPFVPPEELLVGEREYDVIVVDEAAQLSVPLLEQLVLRHPRARFAFATTTRGYEGTGGGFLLRFMAWAQTQARPVIELHLDEPIRWSKTDPMEGLIHELLALDVEIAPAAEVSDVERAELRVTCLDRDALANDELLLRDVFGLLVHAHYRTTPNDLQRLLDAPNLSLHALLGRGRALGACLVAREGSLPPALCEDLALGRTRIRGHALADTLIVHANQRQAGELSMIRSVRLAVHPALRRRGLASLLVEHVHESYDVELFGTLFGATPGLLRFRRSLGYEVVRVGAARGARSGEPAAVMARACSARAQEIVRDLRRELERALPEQLALLGGEGRLAPELAEGLLAGLASPAPLEPDDERRAIEGYLDGAQPYEAAAYALRAFIAREESRLATLDERARELVRGRVLRRISWARAANDAGYASVPAAMKALRPALRQVVRDAPLPPERGSS